ncbi:MAG: hypothetical protein FWE69_03790 [Clostridiales bacterium]|nr:hypothetical protein [Clostridiales bacterium]
MHHKVPLTPDNIHDRKVALANDNLELLCVGCHNQAHGNSVTVADALRFDEDGNLVRRDPPVG